jgi:hypothetical protein
MKSHRGLDIHAFALPAPLWLRGPKWDKRESESE